MILHYPEYFPCASFTSKDIFLSMHKTHQNQELNINRYNHLIYKCYQ